MSPPWYVMFSIAVLIFLALLIIITSLWMEKQNEDVSSLVRYMDGLVLGQEKANTLRLPSTFPCHRMQDCYAYARGHNANLGRIISTFKESQMSHFTVLVAAENDEDLAAKLLPYHEYECTGIEEYTEFVSADMEELQEAYKEYGKGHTFEEFIPEWSGARKNEEGVWGRITNPNAKWDWWVVGGRWSGLLPLKPEAHGKGKYGKKMFMSPEVEQPDHADSALAGEIDWEKMKKESGFTFAHIDTEGQWHEQGRMGWFAIVTDEKEDYDDEWWKFAQSLPKEQRVYVVDCHI